MTTIAESEIAELTQRVADLEVALANSRRIAGENADLAVKAAGRCAAILEVIEQVPPHADFGWHWKKVQDLASEGVL